MQTFLAMDFAMLCQVRRVGEFFPTNVTLQWLFIGMRSLVYGSKLSASTPRELTLRDLLHALC